MNNKQTSIIVLQGSIKCHFAQSTFVKDISYGYSQISKKFVSNSFFMIFYYSLVAR